MAEEAVDRLNAAYFCIACRVETRNVIAYCKATGGLAYRRLSRVCAECDDVCTRTANLFLKTPKPGDYPSLFKQAKLCFMKCRECRVECEKLRNAALDHLAEACHKVTVACFVLATTLEEPPGAK